MSGSTPWFRQPAAVPDEDARKGARARQAILTKPPGALGRLEEIAMQLAALQGTERPDVEAAHISLFAADHGVAGEGVSAFPQSVTGEMVRNFSRGGAAICVLARELGATLEVIDLGTLEDPGPLDGVVNARLAPGTANMCREPAMSAAQRDAALKAGRGAARRAANARLFIGGEMGIGNTTAATALACALLEVEPGPLTGPGTGLDADGVAHKRAVIQQALDLHHGRLADPLEALRRVGGFEIAALCGAYIACAQDRRAVLVDGFIASAAALAATRICPGAENWLLYSHRSGEPGQRIILDALAARPLLDLGLRLGEGSGAASAVPLLRLACALHNEMATFAEAGIAEKGA